MRRDFWCLATRTTSQTPPVRLSSLDAFRGFTMFWITAGAALVTALPTFSSSRLAHALAIELTHTPWQGFRYYDCIWPSLAMITGISLPFSFAKRSLTQTRAQILIHMWLRASILFLLGSLRESVANNAPYLIDFTSGLQAIAVGYLIAAYLAQRSPKFQAVIAGSIIIVHAFVLAFVPGPGFITGTYQKGPNLVRFVDLALLGRAEPDGWGVVLSSIPPIATTILGLMMGELLMTERTGISKARIIATTGISLTLAGFAISPIIPIVMKIYTISYALLASGWACILFAFFYWIIDVRGNRRWAFPLEVIGMNALAGYLGVEILPIDRMVSIFSNPLATKLGFPEQLFSALAIMLVVWSVLYWMYKRKIFLRA